MKIELTEYFTVWKSNCHDILPNISILWNSHRASIGEHLNSHSDSCLMKSPVDLLGGQKPAWNSYQPGHGHLSPSPSRQEAWLAIILITNTQTTITEDNLTHFVVVRLLTLTYSSGRFIRPLLKLKWADCLFHFHKVIVASELSGACEWEIYLSSS